VPGVDVKLIPDAASGKTEIRFRGPNVMPGYWRMPEQTAEAFDDEGFYRTGDAARWIDPADPQRGPAVRRPHGRGLQAVHRHLRQRGAAARQASSLAGDPCVQDAVITGLNRDDVGALLIFPRRRRGAPHGRPAADAPLPEVLHHPAVRAFFQALADRLWRDSTGSANRVARMHVLAEPPSIDKGEVTDKGSINQRAVLRTARAGRALYEGRASDPFLILPEKTHEHPRSIGHRHRRRLGAGRSGGARTARQGAKVAVLDINADGAQRVAADIGGIACTV
jgi:feruloyl-CoA synthase